MRKYKLKKITSYETWIAPHSFPRIRELLFDFDHIYIYL